MAADGEKGSGGISVLFLSVLVGLIGFAYVSCGDPIFDGAAASGSPGVGDVPITDPGPMVTMSGRDVTAAGVRVQHVAADEGFWVDLGSGRVWVQLLAVGESPYTVRDGDVVSFRGRIVAHDDAYPNGLGMCTPADVAALAAQDTHVEVPAGGIAFGVG